MRVLLTGGSGDLGSLLARQLKAQGDTPVIFDLRPPVEGHEFIEGSINDFDALVPAMRGIDCVVHIAALHGIHEKDHSREEFLRVNIQGTQNTLDAASRNGVKKFLFISSTSVRDKESVYGYSKIAGEKLCRDHAAENGMDLLILRPRAFIPPWNRAAYDNYIQWTQWFWRGAVHVHDVTQATLKAVNYLRDHAPASGLPALTVDGAYDYTGNDLENWDADGPGSTFRRIYGNDNAALAESFGLDTAVKPNVLEMQDTRDILGYAPQFSLRNLLDELKRYGVAGPPSPFETRGKPAAPPKIR